ncbi:MAG: PAS domain-containing protein [Gemmatimonadetes bacterium]|nr:PAS domain-containing protein [Gemmatimonadota bacterium]
MAAIGYLIAYQLGHRAGLVGVVASVGAVWAGESLFGAGYGAAASISTRGALAVAVGSTDLLVWGLALWIHRIEAQRNQLARAVVAALAASPDAVLLVDPQGRVVAANESARRLFRATASGLFGLPMGHLIPDVDGRPDALQRLVDYHDPVTAVRVDGSTFLGEVVTTRLCDDRGVPCGWMVAVRDATEQIRRSEEERRTRALTEIGQVIAGIVHELNNPLTSLLAHAELLRMSDLPADARESVDAMEHATRRAASVARQLLDRTRRPERCSVRVSLADVARSVLRSRSASLAARRIRVVTRFEPDIPEAIADRESLEQAVANLVVNAEQAMHGAAGGGTLRVEVYEDGATVVLAVADDGPGVPARERERIFEPFFTTKPVGEGTGLGLAVARRSVRECGGDLVLADGGERGARFEIRFPAAVRVEPVAVGSHAA